jgi:hypothetical protein
MATTRTASRKPRLSLERSIERMRKQLAELALFVKKVKGGRTLEEFDADSERLIAESLGETSALLDAYQYAKRRPKALASTVRGRVFCSARVC